MFSLELSKTATENSLFWFILFWLQSTRLTATATAQSRKKFLYELRNVQIILLRCCMALSFCLNHQITKIRYKTNMPNEFYRVSFRGLTCITKCPWGGPSVVTAVHKLRSHKRVGIINRNDPCQKSPPKNR